MNSRTDFLPRIATKVFVGILAFALPLAAGGRTAFARRGSAKHVTDRYPAAYSFLAHDGIPLKEAFPRAIRKNGYFDGAISPMELRIGRDASGALRVSTLRVVLKGIKPGAYIVGIYGRTAHGAHTRPGQMVGAYRVIIDGKKAELRKKVSDPRYPHHNIEMGTILTAGPIELHDKSTVDISIHTNAHAVGKVMLFRSEEDVQKLPKILRVWLKEKGESPPKKKKLQSKKAPKKVKAKPAGDPPGKTTAEALAEAEKGLTLMLGDGELPARVSLPLDKYWTCRKVEDLSVLDKLPAPDDKWEPIEMPTGEVDAAGAFYRLYFRIPPDVDLSGKSVVVVFDRVGEVSDVYLDGKRIGGCIANSVEFNVNVTGAVQPGRKHELLLAVRHPKGLGNRVLPRRGGYWPRPNGIQATPKLVICGPAFIDWVFLRPSTRKKVLRIDTHVFNPTSKTIKVQSTHTVLDNGKELFSFASKPVDVAAGQTIPVVAQRRWEDARWWWLHDPYLYKVKTQVVVDGGVSDQKGPIPLGFREFWLDGTDYVLNGKRMFLWTRSSNPFANENCVRRYYGEKLFPDYAGESPKIPARLVIPGFGLSSRRAWDDPFFWRHYEAHVRGWARKLCNNPAIVMYSIENECLHCGQHSGHPDLPANLSNVGKALAEVDPTRPYMYNGDGDLLGDKSVPIVNLHYPRNLGLGRLLPDDIHWLDGTGTFSIDSNIGKVTWQRKRPMFIGEAWHIDTVGMPWSLSTHFGERVYEGFIYNLPHWARAVEYYINHYRVNGVMATDAWYVPHLKWRPIDLLDETFRFTYPPGEVTRLFRVVNQTQQDKDLAVTWTLSDSAGKQIGAGKKDISLPGGENAVIPLRLELPKVKVPTECTLSTKITDGGDAVSEHRWTFVSVPARDRPLEELSLTVLDPAGRTASALGTMGAKVRHIKKVGQLRGSGVLVVAAEVPPGDPANRLAEFVANGGRVLYLHREGPPPWSPLKLEWTKAEANFTFVRSPNHPALAGVTDTMLALWHPKYRVATAIPRKPTTGHYRTLVEAGWSAGLQLAPVLEMPTGKGTCIVSQLLLLDKLQTEPVAQHMLASLLQYLADFKPARRMRVAAALSQSHQNFLTRKAGVVCDDLVGTENSLVDYDILLLDATAYLGSPEPVVEFVRKGGTLILRGLTGQTIKRFADLLPTGLSVVEDSYPQTVRQGTPPILDGVNQEDLLWMWGIMREWAPMKNDARIVTHELMGLAGAGADWQALTRNFFNDGRCRKHDKVKGARWSDGTAIAVGKVGAGKVVLDQINWDDGMIYAEDKLVRIVSAMLGNLGASVRSGVRASWSYQPVALRPNRSFGEWMNWGNNNLSRFPTGRVTMDKVPFDIPSRGKQAIMLRAEELMPDMPKEVTSIPINARADELCFLQTCTYGFDFEMNKVVMTYRLHYEDGTSADIRVRYGVTIFDWQRPGQLSPETVMAWDEGTAEHDHAYVYLMRRPNPHPDKTIVSMDVISGMCRAVPVLLGLTLAKQDDAGRSAVDLRSNSGRWAVRPTPRKDVSDFALWSVIGPFDNPFSETDPVGKGYFIEYPPEERIELDRVYRGKAGWVKWRTIKVFPGQQGNAKYKHDGHIDFVGLYPRQKGWGVAYAYTSLYSTVEQDATFCFGSDDGAKMWLNGRQIIGIHIGRGAHISQHVEKIHLNKGRNELLIKVEQMNGGWEMYYRFDDLKRSLSFNSSPVGPERCRATD